MTLRHIILIPNKDRRAAVLGAGRRADRPASASHSEDRCEGRGPWGLFSGDCGCGARGLALVWDGERIDECSDRASRVIGWGNHDALDTLIRVAMNGNHDPLRDALRPLGVVLFLRADGSEL